MVGKEGTGEDSKRGLAEKGRGKFADNIGGGGEPLLLFEEKGRGGFSANNFAEVKTLRAVGNLV